MIDHVFNDVGLQIVENLLNLVSDEILQDTAETLAFVMRDCWGSINKRNCLGSMVYDAVAQGDVGQELWLFLQSLSEAQVQAAYGRSDVSADELHHKMYNHIWITARPKGTSDLCSVEITSCDAYVWLVISRTRPYLG